MKEFEYDIYLDETCHLINDKMPIMCLGYIKIPSACYNDYKEAIKAIKLKHNSPTEIKWNKLSISRLDLYKELIDFFFQNELTFRAILVKNKHFLDHSRFKADHTSFYYTAVFFLLRNPYINFIDSPHKVVLDIKDTRGKEKLNRLGKRLTYEYKTKFDKNSPFQFFQHIRSDENEFLQLADLFIGAIAFKARKKHREQDASLVKQQIIRYLEKKSGYLLDDGTNPTEEKFNIFDFRIQKPAGR